VKSISNSAPSLEEIRDWVSEKRGILTTSSARVYRESYFGNNIIAQNDSPTPSKIDGRGYVLVELWIMSMVEADNPVSMPGEGLTKIVVNGKEISLARLRVLAGDLLFGEYGSRWPLTKVLDIGGNRIDTSFGSIETPPIPVHVHGGIVADGKVLKPGKSEAYFFPPINIPPYNKNISAKTRIGLKPGVTQEDVKTRLQEFGKNDSMYTLLNEFDILPETSWTVPAGVLHAPGPYITFEIQLAQDDYNLASWRLGERLEDTERSRRYQELVLRGLKDEGEYIEQILDWPLTSGQSLEATYFHKPKLIKSGKWGKRYQIFFDQFYGESWEILPGQTMSLSAKEVPQAGIVWSGEGEMNGNQISRDSHGEFLCIPNTELSLSNTGPLPLLIYTVEPIRENDHS